VFQVKYNLDLWCGCYELEKKERKENTNNQTLIYSSYKYIQFLHIGHTRGLI